MFSMRSVHQPAPAVAVVADREAKKTYTRVEFRKLVIGTTKDEILAPTGLHVSEHWQLGIPRHRPRPDFRKD
jgi:hypothetical protein